jgi:hypothetical protein
MAGPLLPIAGAVATAAAKAAAKKAAKEIAKKSTKSKTRRPAATKAAARDTRKKNKVKSENAMDRLTNIEMQLASGKNISPKRLEILQQRKKNLMDMIAAGDDIFNKGGSIKRKKGGKVSGHNRLY